MSKSTSEAKDYKSTIFLPTTQFQMKANLSQTEPRIIEFWIKNRIYEEALKIKTGGVYTLHDGPPYANGHIHLGHALNKVIKDIVVKLSLLSNKKNVFIPGWDCHGLPIEKEIEKKIGKDTPPAEIRKHSREYAKKFIDIQREEFKRLGIFALWDSPYFTMSPDYEAIIIDSINKIWKMGRIYCAEKPVFWCPHCITALAEAEVEYKPKKSPSIYILFPAKFSEINNKKYENLYAVVWTTTPWTIPGNFALAFKKDINYVIAELGRKYIIIADKLLNVLGNCKIVDVVQGDFFENKIFYHPIFGRDSIGVIADFVSEEEGTGIVHIAPGHGQEDFEVGKKYGLPVVSVLDEFGRGNNNSVKYKGIFYTEMNQKVIEDIENAGYLLEKDDYEHSYPHCWRCKNPIVFRSTRQWFIKVDDIKSNLVNEVELVKWIPPEGKNRITATILARPDWCISRQRAWGVPIPYVICMDCGEYIWSEYVAEKIKKDILAGEPDSWWEKDISHFIPPDLKCPKCGGNRFTGGRDILDVWIDSGLSFQYITEKEIPFPLDIYIEGSDQHRGWFQSSLILSVLLKGKAPYRTVFTHGFILDEFRRKMSKSVGNVISPEDIIKEEGAEIIRIWAVFSDPREDVKVSEKIISEAKDVYRKIRNTIRFMLGILGDNPETPPTLLHPTDIFFLCELANFEREILKHYDDMEFHKALRKIHQFADKTLSSLYLDIIKDTIYCDSKHSPRRSSAQYTVFLILRSLLTLIAPIMSFLAEEAYSHIPEVFGFRRKKSIFFEDFSFTLVTNSGIDFGDTGEIIDFFSKALILRGKINEIADRMRKEKKIGSSLELKVKVKLPVSIKDQESILEEFFIVSKVETISGEETELLEIDKYEAKKCLRCWKYSEKVGEAAENLCPRCAEVIKIS